VPTTAEPPVTPVPPIPRRSGTAAPRRPRLMVTQPREAGNGPHAAIMIPRASIRIVFQQSAVRRGLIEAPWAESDRFRGRLLYVVTGDSLTLAVKAEWRSIDDALAALSDLDLMRVNHGIAVNMEAVDVLELHQKIPRLGFHLYHGGVVRRTDFVRIARSAARAIRRDY
jgi:hypothetical protein